MPPTSGPTRPTRAQLEAARSLTVPDVIGQGLAVLFCGINPGLYTAAIGHHFGRPGNRFWPALHRSGFTPRLLAPWEDTELLRLGLGVTNLVPRTTAVASELTPAELRSGGQALVEKLSNYRPRWLAILGVTAYRTAFGASSPIAIGPQAPLGTTSVWLLPNPSGLNAHYQLEALASEFTRLRAAVGTGA